MTPETIISLIIGCIGAITGVISLGWHMLNSRSKVILERVSFTKSERHANQVTIDTEVTIRNKGDKATTLEDMYFEFGSRWIQIMGRKDIEIKPNSSYPLKFSESVSMEEFNELLKEGNVKLGIHIVHTFGRIKKHGYTNFATRYLNL